MALLEATGLIKHFGSVTAVDGIGLTVEPGEIRALRAAGVALERARPALELGRRRHPRGDRSCVVCCPAGNAD